MLLPFTHLHHPNSSIPSKPLTHQSPFPFIFFPSPLPNTLISSTPRSPSFLIRTSASASDTQTIPKSAIQRIADKLRSLGITEETPSSNPGLNARPDSETSAGEIFIPLPNRVPKRRVGYTIDRSWSTPENPVPEPGTGSAIATYHEVRREVFKQKALERKDKKEKRDERAPTLAELTLNEKELRRLRKIGIETRKKLKIGKAGITEGIVNGIHERWRHSEVVKIVCEDLCRKNMKRTHDLLERTTGGLVVWRSGSKIVLYRGANYKYPYFLSDEILKNETSTDALPDPNMDDGGSDKMESFLPSIDGVESSITSPTKKISQPKLIQGVGRPNRVRFQLPGEAQLAEVADRLLEGLGPRFTDWWGYDPLPVDADLLPAVVPGYRRPFRLLPYGVKPILTNDEMTTLKRLGRPMACHFALGRNRNLQGLAASIVKLWEKCEIAKIAVKRGVQNTNSEMMAAELKRLTGGVLLSRDSEFFVLYRGKDFLPLSVCSAIEERRKHVIHGEKERANCSTSVTTAQELKLGNAEGGSESELDGANYKEKGGILEQRMLRSTEAVIKRTSIKLSMALEKKAKAEKLLAELEEAEIPQAPEIDKEGITEEERNMLRKVGLRMKPFLLMGRRGIFDGTVENMHLHWKYRELVKVISKEKSIEAVHQEARTLEAESGGILVAVERVNKGYAIIVYRGKNYKRPASLRPQTLLNKREAMKRSLEAQRRKSLKLHVLKLNRNIDDLKLQLAKDKHGAHSASMNFNEGVDAPINNILQSTQQDEVIGLSAMYEGDPAGKVEIGSSESVGKETHANVFMDKNGEVGAAVSTSFPDNFMSEGKRHSAVVEDCAYKNKAKELSDKSVKTDSKPDQITMENGSKMPRRALQLSNKERLLLRKQALKMKKRPVLAVGRSNIVTGVAKTIMAHFKKHPLAIVNVKGRAEGTSVQEVVFLLEQATGAVLVSQEPSKVILYRGWGAEDKPGHIEKKNARVAGEEGATQLTVSPELLAAIRLECGLQGYHKEEMAL
ncbi:CRM-domain containing factor CFM2, chloroplastic isoform X2 [Juglans microcarpa x Juglans regia]|uniref:CRM-domain containing factor CFM2, chloroplastic isoform X2 n=1 Tax=Juglans microcarpa x Juglans regia TaxID=2249226 RepID=UPI001B7E5B05|nr:CRM-domain containing factor CFM2, chloroplastic isoform X2 [Juglans microcarpa x Juglans regia]